MIHWPILPKNKKYSRIYEQLVYKALQRNLEVYKRNTPYEYYEVHHIIPRSFGGTNQKSNLVKFTAREHYVAHLLLWKMNFGGEYNSKMSKALFYMASAGKKNNKFEVNSRTYEKLRVEHNTRNTNLFTGSKNPAKRAEVRQKISKSIKEKYKKDKESQTGLYAPELLKKRSIINTGKKNARAIIFTFTNIDGISFEVHGELTAFIKQHNLRSEWVYDYLKGKTTEKLGGWSVSSNKEIRCCINDGINQKFVRISELNTFLNKGWILGSKPSQRIRKLRTKEELNIANEKRKETLLKQRHAGVFSSLKGKKRPLKSVKKGAEKRKGKPNPMKGKKLNLSDEQRKKRSERAKLLPKLYGAANPNFGKKHSEEVKKLMSERRKLAYLRKGK